MWHTAGTSKGPVGLEQKKYRAKSALLLWDKLGVSGARLPIAMPDSGLCFKRIIRAAG